MNRRIFQTNILKTSWNDTSKLRIAIQEPRFNHVLRFTRQLYVNSKDILNIAELFSIYHDNTQKRIFISTKTVGGLL